MSIPPPPAFTLPTPSGHSQPSTGLPPSPLAANKILNKLLYGPIIIAIVTISFLATTIYICFRRCCRGEENGVDQAKIGEMFLDVVGILGGTQRPRWLWKEKKQGAMSWMRERKEEQQQEIGCEQSTAVGESMNEIHEITSTAAAGDPCRSSRQRPK